MYKLSDVKYESRNFFVLDRKKCFEVYESGITHAVRRVKVSRINHALALPIAIKHCDKLQEAYEREICLNTR